MANYRQIHVSIWKDSWFLDLEPDEKLLYIYLFSNENTSLSGIYRLARRVIYFETGIDKKRSDEILRKFEEDGKVYTQGDVVWVVKMRKYHETSSTKVQKRIHDDIDIIPNCDLKNKYIAYYSMENRVSIGYGYQDLKEEEEEEVKEEVKEEIEDVVKITQQQLLSASFVEATKIPELTGGEKRWYEALDKMVRAGVEPVDVDRAIKELQDKDYNIVSLSSIVNASISAMSKRTTAKNKKGNDPERYIESLKRYGVEV
jgi:hypothetical protein